MFKEVESSYIGVSIKDLNNAAEKQGSSAFVTAPKNDRIRKIIRETGEFLNMLKIGRRSW